MLSDPHSQDDALLEDIGISRSQIPAAVEGLVRARGSSGLQSEDRRPACGMRASWICGSPPSSWPQGRGCITRSRATPTVTLSSFCMVGRTPGSRSAASSHLSPQFHVFVPDQRGFGDSEKPDSGYDIDDLAADAIAFLDAVSIERATFVGHSFGSFVARRIAIANPRRVARLVLIGTGVSAGTPAVLEARAALEDLPDPVPAGFARDFQASTAYLPLPELFFERIVAESLKLPARLWSGALDGLLAYNDVEQLSRITMPTLLIWGEHDALFPGETRTASSPRFQALGFLFIRRQGIARIGNDLNGSPPISRPSSARSHRSSVTLRGDPVVEHGTVQRAAEGSIIAKGRNNRRYSAVVRPVERLNKRLKKAMLS